MDYGSSVRRFYRRGEIVKGKSGLEQGNLPQGTKKVIGKIWWEAKRLLQKKNM